MVVVAVAGALEAAEMRSLGLVPRMRWEPRMEQVVLQPVVAAAAAVAAVAFVQDHGLVTVLQEMVEQQLAPVMGLVRETVLVREMPMVQA